MRPWVLVLVTACGGSPSSEPAPQRATAPAISAVAPRDGADDLEVAKVNGRPVWGSCVAGQVARGAKTREAALDECIQFELLAQSAEQRGLAADPTVVEATRQQLVSREVALEFEAKTQNPADLGDRMTKWLAANAWRLHRPDLRASTYARVNVPKGSSPDVEAKAKALSAQIAAALANETGLFGVNVREVAERIGKDSGLVLDISDAKQMPRENMDVPYGDALYGIAEIGRSSSPVRTKWGWDVVVWTGGLGAKEFTREQIAAEAFPELRRAAFQAWVNEIVKKLGVKIVIDQSLVARLEESS